jgi:hypothetical protein
VTSLGDDSKLPFQIRLLTAASKQNFVQNNKFSKMMASRHQHHLHRQQQQHQQQQEQPQQSLPQQLGMGGSELQLSDYLYLDKSQTMQQQQRQVAAAAPAAAPPRTSNGFSIAELMRL